MHPKNIDLKKIMISQKKEDQEKIIDQYKIIIDSINSNNELRESANNFWVTVNSLGLSALAYIRDSESLGGHQKPLILWILIFLGVVLCLSWLSYLTTIKKSIDHRYSLIIQMEKYLPVPIFQSLLQESGRKTNRYSLTIREMFVPVTFLLGYLFFSILLIFFSADLAKS